MFPAPTAAAAGGEVLWEHDWANEEPRIEQSYMMLLDHLRPSLVSVRMAASIIVESLSMTRPVVLACELGHSVGPQALSVWMPNVMVRTRSAVIQSEAERAADPKSTLPVDAVVLGVPSYKAMRCAKFMTDNSMGRVVGQKEMESVLREAAKEDPITHVAGLVEDAVGLVKPGGLLVVVGAVEHGEHHHAVAHVAASADFQPMCIKSGRVQLNTVEKPILVAYRPGKKPWRPFGTLGPEDRLISAWRRQP